MVNLKFRLGIGFAVLCAAFLFSANGFCAENDIPAVTDKVKILSETRNGFIHPGIGLTREILEGVREQLMAGREPWLSHFRWLARERRSEKNVVPRNESRKHPGMPDTDAWVNRSTAMRLDNDGTTAYNQALMYFFTGDDAYRRNALRFIRVWSKMNPERFRNYADSHIHSAGPLYHMVQAAEIIRHTSTDNPELAWTREDTETLSRNLIRPAIRNFMYQNGWFMNQNNFALWGAMSGFIFMDDRDGYEQRVEWFTVNRDAPDQGFSGSIKQLARLVTHDAASGKAVSPRVQLAEMGRDQAHAAEDVNLFVMISQIIMGQKTPVDPVRGTVSTAPDAVPVMEFLDDRILKAADHFCRFMLGYDTPWTTIASSIDKNGKAQSFYRVISDNYRGRWTTFNFWPLWYYYTYEKGRSLAEEAPYLDRAFHLRISPGNWLFIPVNAKEEALRVVSPVIPQDKIPFADRVTLLDNKSSLQNEGGRRFVRIAADHEGARLAMLSCATGSRRISFRVRTNGIAEVKLSYLSPVWTLPNTQGEWRQVFYTVPELEKVDNCHFLTVTGEPGTVADIDLFIPEADKLIRPPVLEGGENRIKLIGCVGIPLKYRIHTESAGVAYRLWGAPKEAAVNAGGSISLSTAQVGQYRFFAGIDDNTSIVAREFSVSIGKNRAEALRLAAAGYSPERKYRQATLNRFQKIREKADAAAQNGSDEVFMKQLQALAEATETLEPLTPLLSDGSMDYTRLVQSDVGGEIFWLTDGRKVTAPAFQSGLDLNYCFDFGPNYRVSVESVSMLGWLIFDNRMADATVFASNDLHHWDRITPGETQLTEDYVTLEVAPEFRKQQYRYLKFAKLHKKQSHIFTVSELRIFGTRYELNGEVESVSIASPEALCGRIVPGAAVQLSVGLCEPVKEPKVSIRGIPAKIRKTDSGFTAAVILPRGTKPGKIDFSIEYRDRNNRKVPTVDWTTDGSMLILADDSEELRNFLDKVKLIDTTPNRPARETRKQVDNLFDGKQETGSDFRSVHGGRSSGITFDFGDRPITIERMELLPIMGRYGSRIAGTVLQGSQDGKNWKDLTLPARNSTEWQNFFTSRPVKAYRYYRLFNHNAWFGNLSEVRFHTVK